MKSRIGISLLLFVVAIAACNPVKVYLEKEEVKHERSYKTFAIINQYQGKDAWNSPTLNQNLIDDLVKGMEERGYLQDTERPDLILRYNTLLSENEKEVRDNSYNGLYPFGMYNPMMYRYPFGSPYPYWPSQTEIEKYKLGEVVIDFIDPKADEIILRISAVGEVNNIKQKYKNIGVSVDKILHEFSRNMTVEG
ncbi:DUF4136 domain-containing protein [Echinicola sp. CAU 1574]|uniref:DUF4136 domain-containing protein n=1 Tax=Echinicola arenosa TaxID=2774144 RepID=A0ABR9AP03_9BACT|nr:DUF4136 domain-containing protein [Echinicola arenosa]MBD8490527.1 DUF4136 domain-containing protein [Echinicola arenosa]